MLTAGGTLAASALAALKTLSRPPVATRVAHAATGVTPFRITDLRPATGMFGAWAMSSAAAPATCGAAMLVPFSLL